jgi:hypothetical protein
VTTACCTTPPSLITVSGLQKEKEGLQDWEVSAGGWWWCCWWWCCWCLSAGGSTDFVRTVLGRLGDFTVDTAVLLLEELGISSRLLFFLLLFFSTTSSSSSSWTTPLVTGVGAARQKTGMVSTTSLSALWRKPGGLGGGHVEERSGSFLLTLSVTFVLVFREVLGARGEGGRGLEREGAVCEDRRGEGVSPLVRGREVWAGKGEYCFLRGGPARLRAPDPSLTRLLCGDLRLQLSSSSISFLFSALGCTRAGIFLASWMGVDILSSVSRMSRAVEDMLSEEGTGEGEEEAVEGREEGRGVWAPHREDRASLSVCLFLSPAL